jgi:predicted PurR-regulated permease PerM
MLYIMFFLLRDGHAARPPRALTPFRSKKHQGPLLSKFVTVISATVRGNVAVAAIQGALGGIALVLGIHAPVLWAR